MAKSTAYYLEHFVVLAEPVVSAIASLPANRFVNRAGNFPGANGGYVAGVTQMAAAIGEQVTVTTMGIETVEVGAAITAIDTPLMSDTAGKARPITDATTQKTAAYALDTATGSGVEFIRVKLV